MAVNIQPETDVEYTIQRGSGWNSKGYATLRCAYLFFAPAMPIVTLVLDPDAFKPASVDETKAGRLTFREEDTSYRLELPKTVCPPHSVKIRV